MLHAIVALMAAFLAAVPAHAQSPCGPVDHAATFLATWTTREPAPSPGPSLTMAEAVCTQGRLVEILSKTEGKPIGYKVGLTSPAAQAAFGVKAPVVGVLLEKMLLGDGAMVPASFGARPVFEGDLLATVRDDGINDAKTPMEIARHVSTIQPFIELPDLVIAEGQKLTAPVLVAINVGARRGVVGAPVAVRADEAFVNALASMQVSLRNGSGAELGTAPGQAILGHPFNAIAFLTQELAARGQRLKAGDVVSLGSFGRPLQPKPGQTVTARYEGLPTGPLSVSVTFK